MKTIKDNHMKKIFSLVFGIIVLVSCTKIKKQEVFLDSLSSNAVYQLLFKPQQIILNNECLWIPSVKDSTFSLSYDGYCHTTLDTTIYYHQDGIDKAVIVFANKEFDNGEQIYLPFESVIVSIAIFEKATNGKWMLNRFEKSIGQNGTSAFRYSATNAFLYGEFNITNFGNHFFFCADFNEWGQGYSSDYSTYWHLPSLIESLEMQTSSSDGGRYEGEEQTYYESSTRDASEGNITKFILTKKGKKYIYEQGQVSTLDSTEYILNDSCVFIQVKK